MISISTGIMLSSAAAAAWFGYEAYSYEESAYDGSAQPPAAVAEPFLPVDADDPGWKAFGKDALRVGLLQQPVFDMPEEQSDDTVLAIEFGALALLIGLGKAARRIDWADAISDIGSEIFD